MNLQLLCISTSERMLVRKPLVSLPYAWWKRYFSLVEIHNIQCTLLVIGSVLIEMQSKSVCECNQQLDVVDTFNTIFACVYVPNELANIFCTKVHLLKPFLSLTIIVLDIFTSSLQWCVLGFILCLVLQSCMLLQVHF